MPWVRGQSSGWAAFDLKQKRKNIIESEVDRDPFPPISGTPDLDKLLKKNHIPEKSFSSVVLPAKHFPTLKGSGNSQKTLLGSDVNGNYCGTTHKDGNLALRKLKECHSWADNSLIEDIFAAVNNNVDKASTLLETMASAVNFEEHKLSDDPGQTTFDNIPYDGKTVENLTLAKVEDSTPFRSSLVGYLKDNDKDLEGRNVFSGQNFSDDDNLRCNMGLLNSVPVEPEWKEDDIYISHRRDALKMMRSASRRSRAATNAFLRGEHFSAQQHSMKAGKEWHAAEKLNSKAATEILSIRNSENVILRLDLHGLHASEAIQALQERLNRIENQGLSKSSASSSGVKENGCVHENLDKQQAPLRLKSLALHVITASNPLEETMKPEKLTR